MPRLVARENVKIVTGTDAQNSQGGNIKSIQGIDLIAGNNMAELQPMVKGSNLAELLAKIIQRIDELTGIVDTFLMSQLEHNAVVMAHVHPLPGSPSIELVASGAKTIVAQTINTKMSLLNEKVNLAGTSFNYLSPAGKKYINSRYNSTN